MSTFQASLYTSYPKDPQTSTALQHLSTSDKQLKGSRSDEAMIKTVFARALFGSILIIQILCTINVLLEEWCTQSYSPRRTMSVMSGSEQVAKSIVVNKEGKSSIVAFELDLTAIIGSELQGSTSVKMNVEYLRGPAKKFGIRVPESMRNTTIDTKRSYGRFMFESLFHENTFAGLKQFVAQTAAGARTDGARPSTKKTLQEWSDGISSPQNFKQLATDFFKAQIASSPDVRSRRYVFAIRKESGRSFIAFKRPVPSLSTLARYFEVDYAEHDCKLSYSMVFEDFSGQGVRVQTLKLVPDTQISRDGTVLSIEHAQKSNNGKDVFEDFKLTFSKATAASDIESVLRACKKGDAEQQGSRYMLRMHSFDNSREDSIGKHLVLSNFASELVAAGEVAFRECEGKVEILFNNESGTFRSDPSTKDADTQYLRNLLNNVFGKGNARYSTRNFGNPNDFWDFGPLTDGTQPFVNGNTCGHLDD